MDHMLESSYGWLLYKERFVVLFICMWTSFSAGILWMSYSTITNLAANYYHVSVDEVNFLPICVLICSLAFSLIAMYTLDKKNLKIGLRLGSSLIVFGYFIRIIPKFCSDQQRYTFSLFGHCFVGAGLPFVIFTPSKVAEQWFPDHQRLCVTTFVSVSYLSGLIFSDLVVERIIKNSSLDITDVTIIIGMPSVISLILCFLFLSKSKPITPPSSSSAIICFRPFFPSLAQLIKQKFFILMALYIGVVLGSFFSTILITQELVKVNLNLIVFCGEFAAFYTAGGLLGSLCSLFAAKIRNVVFSMKLLVCGHSIASTLLFLVLRYQIPSIDKYYWGILILIISACTGFFVYTVIPFGLELGSDCSFPNCTEAASNGLLIISGQIFGLILTLLMRELAYWRCICNDDTFNALRTSPLQISWSGTNQTFVDSEIDCTDRKCWYDYTVSLMVQTIIIVLVGSFFIAFFQTEYRRMNSNRGAVVDQILNSEEIDESDTLYS